MLPTKRDRRTVGVRLRTGARKGVRNDGNDLVGNIRKLEKLRTTLRARDAIEGPRTDDPMATNDAPGLTEDVPRTTAELLETVKRRTKTIGGVKVTMRKRGRPNMRRSRIAKRAARMNKSSRRKGARKARKTKRKRRVAMKRIRRMKRPGSRRRSIRSHNEAPLRGALLFDSTLRNTILPNIQESEGYALLTAYLSEEYDITPEHEFVEASALIAGLPPELVADTLAGVPETDFGTCLEALTPTMRKHVLEVYYEHLQAFNEPWAQRAIKIRESLAPLEIEAQLKNTLITAATQNPFIGSVAINRNEGLDKLEESILRTVKHALHQTFIRDDDDREVEARSAQRGVYSGAMNKHAEDLLAKNSYSNIGLATMACAIASAMLDNPSFERAASTAVRTQGKKIAGSVPITRTLSSMLTGATVGVGGLILYQLAKQVLTDPDEEEHISTKDRRRLHAALKGVERRYSRLSDKDLDRYLESATTDDLCFNEDTCTNIQPIVSEAFTADSSAFREAVEASNAIGATSSGIVDVKADGSFKYKAIGEVTHLSETAAFVDCDGCSTVVPLDENSVAMSSWIWSDEADTTEI